MEEVWSNLTDENTDKWLHAINRADRYHLRMLVFRSGMIEPELRNLQLAAHKFYDLMSPQELRVFKQRTLGHTFVDIAVEMQITESSVKEYWRRTLKKIGDVIEKTNSDEEKES
jgi:DNA-binding NarL/FixJ family response regulator